MKSILKILMNPIANLNEELKQMMPLSIALGHENDVFVLLKEEPIPLIDGCFPATVTEQSYRYQVIHLKDGQKKVLDLPKETWNYHYIQPIDDGQFLLVCARSYYHDAQNIEENARVYDENGRFIRSFCLGDGIGHVYVTKNQEIWTGYFDEGVFGNYGWKDPVGRSGLVGWDVSGAKLDSLEEDKEYFIFECLALNGVADGGIWFFFSLDSKIGVRKEGLTSYYSPEDIYFQAFAVNGETIVAYRGRGDTLLELHREGNEYKTVRKIELMRPDGKPFEPQLVNNRESKLLFLDGDELYMYEVKSGV
ncbi:hypothetical protein EYB33_12860 [Lysinibacillus sphaericus]|uniref:hypothetical protein n=1 Tax=Lysinibacillus sphaericus TaxID=1421 RepID=UPI001E5FAF9B|nr:hypothetical protein [Lysinibacillus sphaericus]UDK97134.1 hypothetical protein EYB33_12860 [Lysinibacillus sphaericus]